MPATLVNMPDADFDRLRQIIYERSGIHFQESKKYVLESRLSRRLEELEMDDFGQYIAYLTMGPYQIEEFQEMFNRITINETSFFRNQPQLDVFEHVALPEALKRNEKTKRLRIWSAACSSGEEPYTIAMQIHRALGVRLPDWHIEILGTDISEKVLMQAQKGRYTEFSFRSVNPLIKKRYFTEDNNEYILSEDIKAMVNFEVLNLKDSLAAKRYGTWDIIFCRNVMIYFDDEMKARVAQTFFDQLHEQGVLFIGHSESLRNLGVEFEAAGIPQGFAYTKRGYTLQA